MLLPFLPRMNAVHPPSMLLPMSSSPQRAPFLQDVCSPSFLWHTYHGIGTNGSKKAEPVHHLFGPSNRGSFAKDPLMFPRRVGFCKTISKVQTSLRKQQKVR